VKPPNREPAINDFFLSHWTNLSGLEWRTFRSYPILRVLPALPLCTLVGRINSTAPKVQATPIRATSSPNLPNRKRITPKVFELIFSRETLHPRARPPLDVWRIRTVKFTPNPSYQERHRPVDRFRKAMICSSPRLEVPFLGSYFLSLVVRSWYTSFQDRAMDIAESLFSALRSLSSSCLGPVVQTQAPLDPYSLALCCRPFSRAYP